MPKAKHPTCRWCGNRLDSRKHQNTSESACYIRNEKAIRSRMRPRVKRVQDAYEGGRLKGVFSRTDMEDILLRRQETVALDALLRFDDPAARNGYKVPGNVSEFVRQGFVWNQIAVQKPWAVYVFIDGRRKRKRFNNLHDAIMFHRRCYKRGLSAGIVSLCHHYELPRQWLLKKEKLPKKFKWCPRCAAFRVFRKVDPPTRFYAMKKVWSDTKDRYEWTDRLVWLTECQLCGCTNKDPTYRRANQPVEVRKIKRGARRIKKRTSTEALRKIRVRQAR